MFKFNIPNEDESRFLDSAHSGYIGLLESRALPCLSAGDAGGI
jgi:hypothetical protein